MRNLTPVHGIDYLQDHYALLGIEKDADENQIHTAYHRLAKTVHPDRFIGLDQELQLQAEQKLAHIMLAYTTLNNPEKKTAYDQQLAQFEQHLICKDGTPIVDLSRRRVDLDFLVSGTEDEEKAARQSHAKILSGYNEAVFTILEQAYQTNPNDHTTRDAYRDQLERKNAYVAIVEELEWESAGISNPETPRQLLSPDAYLDARKSQIERAKVEISESVDRRVNAITNGTAPLLLTSPLDAYTTETAKSDTVVLRERLTGIALSNFEKQTASLEKAAAQRATILEQLVSLTEWEYYPSQQPNHDRILIVTESKGKAAAYFTFELSAGMLETVSTLAGLAVGITIEELKSSQYQQRIQSLVEAGTNVALLTLNNEIDVLLQISYVLQNHFDKRETE